MNVWIGIDPGKTTGIAVRDRDRYVWHAVIEGETEPLGLLTANTLSTIHAAVQEAEERAAAASPNGYGIAVEGLVPPRGRARGGKSGAIEFISPLSLAIPGIVIGYLRAWWPTVVMVPPGGHGARPLTLYPEQLVTPAERRRGLNRPAGRSSTIRHARSGWDVAGAATAALRLRYAGGAA